MELLDIKLDLSKIKPAIHNWLFKEIHELECYPRGYWFAWREWERDVKIAMPIPLNFICNWIRTAWHWCKRKVCRRTVLDKIWYNGYSYGRYNKKVGDTRIVCGDCGSPYLTIEGDHVSK